MCNVLNELTEAALKLHKGNAEKAKQEVTYFLNNVKSRLSENEREYFHEKSGMFISDSYSVDEADAAALDMIWRNRPPRDTASYRKERKGTEALEYITGKGIALIGVYASGATITKGEAWAAAFTSDMNIINALRAGTDSRTREKITRFYFIPRVAGLLCLDIDRKNGKDGIKEFYTWAEKQGKPRHLLPGYLHNIPDSFPCYARTPSNGFHLYFKYNGDKPQKRQLSQETPAVEIKFRAPGLTSPGSYKDSKPYILFGELENAPPLPAFIIKVIEPPKRKAPAYVPHTDNKKQYGKPSWGKIKEWTQKDGSGSGRNDMAFNLARHARNHGYTEAETITALKNEPSLEGLPEKEVMTAAASAYKIRRLEEAYA